jgi:hypothetical protein
MPLDLAAFLGRVGVMVCAPESTETQPGPLPLRKEVKTGLPPFKLPTASLKLHVSPQGNDSGTGSEKEPFASLERARDEIRLRRDRGLIPAGSVEVLIHGGRYQVSRTFDLQERDSGSETAPIIYRAAESVTPIFSGGTRLTGWRRVTENDGYPLLPAASRTNIWIVDLQNCGVTNVLPLKLGGFASGNGFRTHPAHELFFNGQAMQLARGPNDGFLHISQIAVKDGTKGYDREGSKTGKFYYEGDRPSRWAAEPDLLLYGYWFWDWADSYERVATIDPEHKLITLALPWHTYGFSVGAPFYAVNALSELDQPGEWYLDRTARRVLFLAPSDPGSANVELSRFDAPFVTISNASWIRFVGVTWELGSADAVHVREGSHVLFAGCTARRFAGNGIEIHGGTQHGLRSCDVYSMGRGGVVMEGGNRRTLEPGGHFVENCDIHELSRIDHTYTPAVILDGVGNRIAHNRMHDIRSSAMRVEGNDHQIEYNEIYSAVTESDDQGGVDMFGDPTYRGNVYRYNYFHHVGNWRQTGEQPKCGQAGIRLDDAISGTKIIGNVFERCSAGKLGFGGVQIHGGKDNVLENNLFINCAAMVSCSPWDEKRWWEYVKNSLESPKIERGLYLSRYPALAQLTESVNRNLIRQNLGWRCGEMLRRAPRNLELTNNAMLRDDELVWPAVKSIKLARPGFEPIPFEEIGLYRDPALRTN